MLGGETPVVTGPSGTVATATVTSATFAGARISAAAPEGVAAADWPLDGIGVPRVGGGYDIRTAPLFQTGDERYAWLNNVQAVGIGGTIDGGVEYQIFAVK